MCSLVRIKHWISNPGIGGSNPSTTVKQEGNNVTVSKRCYYWPVLISNERVTWKPIWGLRKTGVYSSTLFLRDSIEFILPPEIVEKTIKAILLKSKPLEVYSSKEEAEKRIKQDMIDRGYTHCDTIIIELTEDDFHPDTVKH